jgi:hypothetical protein
MDEEDERTQHLIDTAQIFGPDGNNPPRADDPLVKALIQSMDECGGRCCDRTDRHLHLYGDEENEEEVVSLGE